MEVLKGDYIFRVVRQNDKQTVIGIIHKSKNLCNERFEYVNNSMFTTLEDYAENF